MSTPVILVLGAGGLTGAAWEHGALSAFSDYTGWDPRMACAWVGVSAGSWLAAALATGHPLTAAVQVAQPPAPQGNLLRRAGARLLSPALGRAADLYTVDRRSRLPSLSALRADGLLHAPGVFSTEGMARRLRTRLPEADAPGWPHERLRVIAYDLVERRRVAFGAPTAPSATLVQAVTASSAIPGIFRPVTIDGRPFADGGIVSTSCLDHAKEFAAEAALVLCLAPMAGDQVETAPSRYSPRIYGYQFAENLARTCRTRLEREAAALREQHPDLDLLVLRPNAADRRVMGVNFMDGGRTEQVRRRAYRSTARWLERPETRAILQRHALVP